MAHGGPRHCLLQSGIARLEAGACQITERLGRYDGCRRRVRGASRVRGRNAILCLHVSTVGHFFCLVRFQVDFRSVVLLPGWDLKPRCVVAPIVEAVLKYALAAHLQGNDGDEAPPQLLQEFWDSAPPPPPLEKPMKPTGATVPRFVLGEGRMSRAALQTHWELPTQVHTPAS